MKKTFVKLMAAVQCLGMFAANAVIPAYADSTDIEIICYDQLSNEYNTMLEGTWNAGTETDVKNAVGKFIGATAANGTPSVKAGFTFTATKSGYYDAEFILASGTTTGAKCYASGNHSRLNYWLDDDTDNKVKLQDDYVTGNKVDATVQTVDISPFSNENFNKTKLIYPIYIEAGEHVIHFESAELSARYKEDKVGFYSITFTETDTSKLNDITIHAGDYPTFSYVNTSGTATTLTGETNRVNLIDGGKLLVLYKQDSDTATLDVNDDGYTFSAPFTVYDDGSYDVNIKGWFDGYLPLSRGGYGSKVKVSVDDGPEAYLKTYATTNDSEIFATIEEEDLSAQYNLEAGLWRNYKLTKPLSLTKGEHVIKIRVSDQINNATIRAFRCGFDTIHIRPVAEASKVLIEGEALEKKDLDDVDNIIENALYSNGKAGAVKDAGTVRMPFYISEAGTYNLGVTANTTESAVWKIDDTVMSGFTSIRSLPSLGAGWADYKSANSVTLSAGVHVFEMTAGTGAVFYLDKVEIFKPAEVEKISLEIPEVVALGNTCNIVVKNENGETLTFFDVENMSFESGNEDIVTVDAYGQITPVSFGETTVNACVTTSSGKLVSGKCVVKVAGESGLYVKNASVSGENVSVTLAAVKAASASKIIVAAYNVKDGNVTSFKVVNYEDAEAISEGGSVTKTITLSGISTSDKVVVFVFDSMEGMKPLYGKVIVR